MVPGGNQAKTDKSSPREAENMEGLPTGSNIVKPELPTQNHTALRPDAVREVGAGFEGQEGNASSSSVSAIAKAKSVLSAMAASRGPSANKVEGVTMNGSIGSGGPASTMTGTSVRAGSKTKIIKRYQNRKLYDTQQSCYVTLDDIAKMIRLNEEVMVVDNKTKNDITAATLTQIIFEAEKKASIYPPLMTLREIIQNANGSFSSFLAKLGAIPEDFARQEAAPIVSQERTVTDDLRQSLENRVAKAAQADSNEFAARHQTEVPPALPNSNKSLDN